MYRFIWKEQQKSPINRIFKSNLAAILDAMLELTAEKFSKLHIIYKKRTFIATKANFTHTNLNDILMYKKQKT